MANSTAVELLQGYGGILAFGLYFLAPGYLWARVANLAGFADRSRSEKFLWSLALSVPLAIALCAIGGRALPPIAITCVLLTLNVAAAIVFFRSRRGAPARRPDTPTLCALGLMALFGLYCVAAVTDVQIGHRLYVNTVITDWSVRVPLVEAAMRSGIPPINGLSTLDVSGIGHAPTLRYFYFWYVVVAHMARLFHIPAHAALAASCAWAGWALIASFLLALKYLISIREKLRAKCCLGIFVGGILGLDILPTTLLWISPHLHPYTEMEYWRQDRTPSFLGAVIYAPHHIAAFAALLASLLVLFVASQAVAEERRRSLVAATLFAGIAFAAAAGTSLFPAFCFVIALTLWAVDLLRRRQYAVVTALAMAGALSLLLAHGFLHDLSSGTSAAGGFAKLAWRNDDFVATLVARYHLFAHFGRGLSVLARQPLDLLLDFIELGVYTLVLSHRVRRDLLTRGRLAAGQCALWAMLLGAAIPFFLLNSSVTSGPNDLGTDAGFLVRVTLQVWSVNYLWQLYRTRAQQHLLYAAAVILVALGLSAQLYQIASQRLYYAVIGTDRVHKQMDELTKDHLAARLYNLREAYRQFDAITSPSAPDTDAIQFNPVGVMLPAVAIYNDHQVAAWDTGCGTAFGGDYARCRPIYLNLLALYGNTERGVIAARAANDRQDAAADRTADVADFAATCSALYLRALVVESTDSIWARRDSWVWTQEPLVANETVRIFACPTT